MANLFVAIEAVNGSATYEQHYAAQRYLDGYVDAVVECTGIHRGALLMKCDMFYINKGVDRPMCGGEFLDWEPKKEPTQ